MPDQPVYTQRERAQSYLINNIQRILNATGRNKAFPGIKEDDHLKTPALGPPPVAIVRLVGDDRDKNGHLKTGEPAAVLPTDDPNAHTTLSTFTPTQYFNIFDLESSVTSQLQADVSLWKVYPDPARPEGYPVEFKSAWLDDLWRQKGNENRKDKYATKIAEAEAWDTIEDAPKVGITGLSIKRLGGNPAQVESNIEVSVTIETHNLQNLFFRHVPKDLPKNPPKSLTKDGIAWIDLIKLNPGSVLKTGNCDRIYNEDELRIKLKLGYYYANDSLSINRLNEEHIRRSSPLEDISEETKAQMEALGTRFDPGVTAKLDRQQARPPQSGKKTTHGKKTVAAINEQAEILTLVLKNHDIIIDTDLTVRMTINFVGYSEVLQRTPTADLLDAPEVAKQLLKAQNAVAGVHRDLEVLSAVPDIDEMPEGTEEEKLLKDAAKKEARIRKRCVQQTEERLKEAQDTYDGHLLYAKRQLYNQLRLEQGTVGTSRVYELAIPKADPIWFVADPGLLYRTPGELLIKGYYSPWKSVSGLPPNWASNLKNDRVREQLDVAQLIEASGYDQHGRSTVIHIPEWEEDFETKREEALKNLPEFSQYRFFQFVFLGDIIEAALEIVAYNNRPYTKGAGRNATPFFQELDSEGNLGPYAVDTIKRFGKYVFGDIKIPDPHMQLAQYAPYDRYINIADIPIDLEFFRTFWYNEVVSKPKITKYHLRNLVIGLLDKLLPYALTNRISLNANSPSTENPQAIMTHFSLAGQATALNLEEWEVDYVPDKLVTTNYRTGGSAAHPSGRPPRSAAGPGAAKPPKEWAATEVERLKSSGFSAMPYLLLSTAQKKVTSAHKNYYSQSFPESYDIFAITQKANSSLVRRGNSDKDRNIGIIHFKMESAEKKMLLNIKFNRNDLPALQTANIMSGQGENKQGILREKYDATVHLYGTVALKPGAIIYIDPDALQNAVQMPKVGTQPDGTIYKGDKLQHTLDDGTSIALSAARTLGVGGYFVVITVEHDFGDLGTGGDWRTILNTKWLSFKHIEGLADSCTQLEDEHILGELSKEAAACLRKERSAAAEADEPGPGADGGSNPDIW